MNSPVLFSRRSVCVSGGGMLVLGLTGCGPESGPPIVGEIAGILITAYTRSPFVGKLGGYAIEFLAQQSGLFDIQDSFAAESVQLSDSGKEKYDAFKKIPANYRLAYEEFIPEFSLTVTNNTDSLIDVGEVSCVMYSQSDEAIERIISDEYINLDPGQSTTLSQFFRFNNVSHSDVAYIKLETRYNEYDPPLSNTLLALVSKSTLTQT